MPWPARAARPGDEFPPAGECLQRTQEDFPLETPRVSERVTTRIKMRARTCLCALLLGSSLAINVIDVDSEMIDTMINGERNVLLM